MIVVTESELTFICFNVPIFVVDVTGLLFVGYFFPTLLHLKEQMLSLQFGVCFEIQYRFGNDYM